MKSKLLVACICLAAVFGLWSCSGSAGYDSAKSQALIEKIKNHEELSDDDYSVMIDQLSGAYDEVSRMSEQAGDDKAKMKELRNSPEFSEIAGTLIYFGIELDRKKDDLSNSNKKKLNKVMEKAKESEK